MCVVMGTVLMICFSALSPVLSMFCSLLSVCMCLCGNGFLPLLTCLISHTCLHSSSSHSDCSTCHSGSSSLATQCFDLTLISCIASTVQLSLPHLTNLQRVSAVSSRINIKTLEVLYFFDFECVKPTFDEWAAVQ